MNRKILIVFVLTIALASKAQQSSTEQGGEYLPKITPPSPTAYELGKYGHTPVGLFTGTPKVDIPLYTYKSKNIEVPISLSYRSNGIKVNQLSTNVGLSWSLNAGGVITRVVRDKPDEDRLLSYPEGEPRGLKGLSSTKVREYYFQAGAEQADSGTDLFTYSFMGHSGSFVIDESDIVMVPNNDLIVDKNKSGFKITDSKGIEYYFFDAEETRILPSGRGKNGVAESLHFYTTAWYLSKIKDPKKNHQINFRYESLNYSYVLNKEEQLKVPYPPYNNDCSTVDSNGPSGGYKLLPEVTNTLTISGKKLVEINNNENSAKIVFSSYDSHPEVLGFELISEMQVLYDNTVMETISFEYLKTNNKRVFLKGVNYSDPTKTYSFLYYDPEGLPVRLSKAQDHWGYYNGNDNNRYWFPNPKSIKFTPIVFNTINIGADKSISPGSSEKGLLKKVTYPTKGYSEFVYEQNSYYDEVKTRQPLAYRTLEVITNEGLNEEEFHLNSSKTIFLNDVAVNQDVTFTIDVSFNFNECAEDLLKSFAFIEIIDKSSNESVRFYGITQNGNLYRSNLFRSSNTPLSFNARLTKGHLYEVKLFTTSFCTKAYLSFSYENKPPLIKKVNIPLGGKRIKQSVSASNSNNSTEMTRYYYGRRASLNQSSGIKGNVPNYFTYSTVRIGCENMDIYASDTLCDYVDLNYVTLNSSSIWKLFNSDAFTTYYKYVTVSYGGTNFESGGEENEFIVHENHPGNRILGEHIKYSPLVNAGWSNGLLSKKTVFKKNDLGDFINLNETLHSYKLDDRLSNSVYGYSIRKKFDLVCYRDVSKLDNLDILEYTTNSYWFYRDSTIQRNYDQNGSNPIETITDYFYENPKHKQLTKTKITTSAGKTITKKIYYPDDVTSPTSLSGEALSYSEFNAIKLLQSPSESNPNAQHRIGEVIQEVNEVSGNAKTLSKRNNYANWNGKILPKSIETSKSANTTVGNFEERAVFHRYDSHANPLEISQKDGPHTVYLYGYTKQRLIAQIQNATFREVATALGISESALEGINENHLAQINGLRAKKPEWMITTYTHIPLIGMETVTDPKGLTTTYEYDDFNRLKHIKDHEYNILESYGYNYKTD